MIGIIAAMDAEVNELKDKLSDVRIEKISNIEYYIGTLDGKEVVVAKCGVGKVFAAMCTETMILKYNPQQIIHIGIAGALVNDLKAHELAIASEVIQHDYDQTAFGYPKGKIQGLDDTGIQCDKTIVAYLTKCAEILNIKYKIGIIVSGDQFITNIKSKENLVKEFNAIAVEMEGASTGQVCKVNGISFAVIRVIADESEEDEEKYKSKKQSASDVATRVVLEYLKSF